MDEKLRDFQKNEDQEIQNETKKRYLKPVFNVLGPMQKVTLGGSFADEDSGQGPGPGAQN